MLPGILPIVQGPPRMAFPDVTWIGQADSTALIGGGSPLEAGMEVIAVGAAFNGAGATPVVTVPSGWTNHAVIAGGSSGNRQGMGIWSKRLTGAETPDFFTNHSAAQLHFYGFRNASALLAAYAIPTITSWSAGDDALAVGPQLGNLSAIGVTPFLIVGAFRSSGTVNDDTINYNSGDKRQLRNANSQTNNYLVSRVNFLPGIKSIPTGYVSFSSGDNGNANAFIGCALTIG